MRGAGLSLIAGLILASSMPGQKPARLAKQAERAEKQAARKAEKQAERRATAPVPKPGELVVDRLSRMTPDQRDKALAALPPERRARVEKNLQDFEKLPQAQQDRMRSRLELLNDLPPRRQVEVRRSMRDFNQMPQDRKQAMNQELRRMSAMSDDQRRARLNSDEFKDRFSPDEQRTMNDLAEIQPH